MTKANLREIVSVSSAAGAEVLLLGMRVPPNYGSDYERRFADIFPSLAEDLGVPLVPFLLEGVAADPELNLADGIHPNGEGHRRLAATVVPYLETMLERLQLSGPPPGP
jgi:acyl-CoA thioesterase-1